MHLRDELAMHERRAREIRTLLGLSKPSGEWLEILECQAGALRIAFPLEAVVRAELAALLHPLPDTPPWIAGQLHWHTQAVPILHVGLRLGQPEYNHAATDRIVICSFKNNLIGFLVQTIHGPSKIKCSEISDIPQEIPYTNYFIGSIHQNGEVAYIIGIEAMVAFSDIPDIAARESRDV